MNVFECEPGARVEGAFWGGTLYELQPGETTTYHWHYGEEELCVVVAGSVTLRAPGGERTLGPWDVAWFVRGEQGAHGLRNDGDEPARVLFFSTVSDPEVVVYPDENRVGAIAGWSRESIETLRGWIEPA